MEESGTGVEGLLPSPSTCSPPCIVWSVAPPPPPPAAVSLARSCSDCGGKGEGDAKSGGGVRPFRRILSETWNYPSWLFKDSSTASSIHTSISEPDLRLLDEDGLGHQDEIFLAAGFPADGSGGGRAGHGGEEGGEGESEDEGWYSLSRTDVRKLSDIRHQTSRAGSESPSIGSEKSLRELALGEVELPVAGGVLPACLIHYSSQPKHSYSSLSSGYSGQGSATPEKGSRSGDVSPGSATPEKGSRSGDVSPEQKESCDTCSCDTIVINPPITTDHKHIILTQAFSNNNPPSNNSTNHEEEKIRVGETALHKDDILAPKSADGCVTSELMISIDKAYDNLTDDYKLKRELKERHSKRDKDTTDNSPPSLKAAAASVCKASLPRRRLPDGVMKSSGSNHKITVYVKYEEQLKEGCVDSDGEQESKCEKENTINVVPLTENINICNTRVRLRLCTSSVRKDSKPGHAVPIKRKDLFKMLGLNDSMDVLDPTSIEDARKLALNNILSPPPPVNNTPHKEAKEGMQDDRRGRKNLAKFLGIQLSEVLEDRDSELVSLSSDNSSRKFQNRRGLLRARIAAGIQRNSRSSSLDTPIMEPLPEQLRTPKQMNRKNLQRFLGLNDSEEMVYIRNVRRTKNTEFNGTEHLGEDIRVGHTDIHHGKVQAGGVARHTSGIADRKGTISSVCSCLVCASDYPTSVGGAVSSDSGHSSPMSAAGHSPICHTRGATAAGSRDTISAVTPGGSRDESADLDASSQANTSLDASGSSDVTVIMDKICEGSCGPESNCLLCQSIDRKCTNDKCIMCTSPDPPLSQQFVHVLPPPSLKPPTLTPSIAPPNSQSQFPNTPTINQSDASIVKSRDVTSQSADFCAGNSSGSAVPPLPKKTVAPYQEYKFGFEEPMPELKIPRVSEEKISENQGSSANEGLSMLLGIQKRKKNATRRMEQILKIHTVKDSSNNSQGMKSLDKKRHKRSILKQGGRDEYMNMSRNKNSKVKFSASLRRKENGKSYLRRKIRPCQVHFPFHPDYIDVRHLLGPRDIRLIRH